MVLPPHLGAVGEALALHPREQLAGKFSGILRPFLPDPAAGLLGHRPDSRIRTAAVRHGRARAVGDGAHHFRRAPLSQWRDILHAGLRRHHTHFSPGPNLRRYGSRYRLRISRRRGRLPARHLLLLLPPGTRNFAARLARRIASLRRRIAGPSWMLSRPDRPRQYFSRVGTLVRRSARQPHLLPGALLFPFAAQQPIVARS